MPQIKLAELSIVELKALAYDFIAQKEDLERNLQSVNNEISLRLRTENHIPASNHNSLMNT